jgi:L-arabinose isomerase
MTKPKVGLFGILEKTEEGWERSAQQVRLIKEQLEKAGMQVFASEEIIGDDKSLQKVGKYFRESDPDLLFAYVITWSFDHLVLSILRHIDRPMAILSVPGINTGSLVGAQQLGYLLTEQNKQYSAFFGPPDKSDTYEPILSYAKAAAVKRRMEKGKIIQIGRRCRGMSPAAFDELEITRLFGPQVETFSWQEVEGLAESMKPSEAKEIEGKIKSIDPTTECAEIDIEYTARMYLTLKNMYEENDLIAISLGGYPQYAGKVCLVSSLLGEEGIVSGCCEGDMNSVIAMYLLQEFSGQPTHFGEMLEVDEVENSVVTSHCGCSAPKLAADASQIRIAPVRLFDQGACIKFPAKSGPATFANLVGRRGTYRICAVEGHAQVTDMVFEGNPVKMVFNVPITQVIKVVFEKGFGHHWIMGYAHMIRDLENFCKISNLEGTFFRQK